jgi:hypothetical protein
MLTSIFGGVSLLLLFSKLYFLTQTRRDSTGIFPTGEQNADL